MNQKPFETGYLPEQNGHKVYYAQYGDPNGAEILVCHGGPGNKIKPHHFNNYDLNKYHLIAFDQRGCGQSFPQGMIKNNTLKDLITDIERLRKHLRIITWYVAGGSWGSTVALAYAESYPSSVRGLLLSSIFLGRDRDVEWAFSKNNGIDRIFPDVLEERKKFFAEYKTNQNNSARDLLKQLQTNKGKATAIAAGVMNWEGNLMSAQYDVKYLDSADVSEEDVNSVQIFLHYESNKFFLQENQLLNHISAIKNIPAIIVHGRYDILCPMEQAWAVQKNLTNSEIIVLPTSNHRLTAEGELARKLAFTNFLLKHSK